MVIGFLDMVGPNETPPPRHGRIWAYRVDRTQIAYLRFLLEGYDGIAVLETLDPAAGRVLLRVAPGCEPDVRDLLDALKGEFPMTRLDPPAGEGGAGGDG
jgi:hypothetical protein